eukprot:m.208691 g.208691  ORF g.208691 m.208691 type:complete len:134 (+) comp15457_c0_seq4:1239-1640(+)
MSRCFHFFTDGRFDVRCRFQVVPRGAVLDQVVTELRDVFPTFLDAIGASNTVPPNHTIDGSSLLCLLGDPSGKTCNWRQVLIHSTPPQAFSLFSTSKHPRRIVIGLFFTLQTLKPLLQEFVFSLLPSPTMRKF